MKQMSWVFLGLLPLFVLPTGQALIGSSFLYASMLWWKLLRREPAALGGVIFCGYFGLALCYHVLGWQGVAPLTGIVIYGGLALYFLGRAVRGSDSKAALLHVAICGTAIAVSFLLRPHVAYIFAPIALVTLGFMTEDRWRKLLYPSFYRRKGFKVERVASQEARQRVDEILSASYGEIYLHSGLRSGGKVAWQEFLVRCLAPSPGKSSVMYLIRSEEGIAVGCFQLYFLAEAKRFPFEIELGMDLGWMRRELGTLAEVGRLAILPEWRNNGSLWECLFHALAHECVAKQVAFVVCQAVSHVYPMYRKMGFQPFLQEGRSVLDREFQTPCVPCYLNLARKMGARLAQASVVKGTSLKRRRRLEIFLSEVSRRQVNEKSLLELTLLPPEAVQIDTEGNP